MNAIDDLWQRLLDQACARWSARPPGELKALPQFTEHKVSDGPNEISYALWHENPAADWGNLQPHSFVLQANRKSGLLFQRNYLAGFSLDENDAIIPIADDVIAHYE